MIETITVADVRELASVASRLASELRAGDAVALSGPLGAGKTTFAAALVRALHGDDAAVSSPTFVLRQRYDGAPPVEHLDLYRVSGAAEAIHAGLLDAFDGDAVALVEWPERAPEIVPARAVRVTLAGHGDGPRTIVLERP